MDEVVKKFVEERVKYYVDDYMSKQKDNLLIQLIGFLEDEKEQMSKKVGSEEIQKNDKYNYTEMRPISLEDIEEAVENEDENIILKTQAEVNLINLQEQ